MTRRLVHFSPLDSSDATEIAKLQHRLFPADLRETADDIRKILVTAEKHMVCNMSFGLYDGSRMVGYVFAYVETESLFYTRPEEVLYIKEVALLPRYESSLRALFGKLYQLWYVFTPGLPLEAHALPESLENWQRMLRVFRFYGLTAIDTTEKSERGRPPYRVLRLDVGDTTRGVYETPKRLPRPKDHLANDVTVTVVTDPRQWLSLRERWDSLLEDTEDSNVFQTFDYLWEWWKTLGVWSDLYVVVIRQRDDVIGVVPQMRYCFPIFGKTIRKLMFITAPMEMSRPKMIFGNNGAVCWPAYLAHISGHVDNWDILDIDEQLIERSAPDLREYAQTHGWLIADSETVCPYIDLSGTWADFLSGRSRRMRGNVNRMRRKMSSSGNVRIRKETRWPALDAAMDTYCELENRSWKAKKGLALADDKSAYHFYRSLAEIFGRNGSFELRIMELDDKPIAGTFGIAHRGVFQSLKIAHDSEFDRYSPGTVLESYELEAMHESGLRRYEFMGSFLTNKLRWTSTVVPTQNIHIYQRQIRLMLFYFIYFVLKRRIAAFLKRTSQFERAERLLKKFRSSPFPRY